MKTEDLKKLKEEIDKVLGSAGIGKDQISEISDKILKVKDEKDRKVLASEIVRDLFKPVIDEAKLIKAIENINIEPQITVQPTKVEFKVPEPKVIVKSTPAPKVSFKPNIIVKGQEFPNEIAVTGFGSFVKALFTVLRGRLDVKLGDVSKKNPLPVVLTFESEFYKSILTAVAGGGGSSRVWIKNADNQIVSPITERHKEVSTGTAAVVTGGVAVQLPSAECKRLWIQVNEWNGEATNCPNGGAVAIGGSEVVATPMALRQGRLLYPTQGDWFYVSNLNLLYIDSTDDGAKIHYLIEV